MTLSEKIFIASVATGAVALSLAFGLGGQAQWSPVFLALGALWWAGRQRRQTWATSLGLFGFITGAVLGVWTGLTGTLVLIAIVAALAAWDLDDFVLRLQDVEQAAASRALERRHLLRLGAISGLGLLLGGLALVIRVDFNFTVVFGLSLLAVFGLSRLIKQLWR